MSTPTITNCLRNAGFPEGWIKHQLGLQAERDALLAENTRLREALRAIVPYREHNWDCESRMTEFCTCGMKQAADAARLILNQTAALAVGKGEKP